MPIGPYTRQIENLQIGGGDASAILSNTGRYAQEAGETAEVSMSPYQKFMEQIGNMLQQAQQGIVPQVYGLESQALGLEIERARAGLTQTPQELIGAPPSLQAGVREAEMAAYAPGIERVRQTGKGLSTRLSLFTSALEQAQELGKTLQEDEEAKRKEAIEMITKFPNAVKALPDKERKELLKRAQVPEEFLQGIPVEIEEKWTDPYKLDTGETAQKNSKTGEIKVISKPTGGATSQQFKNLKTYIEGSRAALNQLREKMKDIDFPKNFIERYTKGQANKIAAITQADSNLARFNAIKNGIVSLIARARGEVGVLTEQDIQRVKDSMPNLDDTYEVAIGKLADIELIFDEFIMKAGGETTQQQTSSSAILKNSKTGELKQFNNLTPEDIVEAISQGFELQ